MRVLLIIVAVVLLLALVGWIKFHDAPEQSTITIEKETIRQDAEKMVERGNEFVEDARQAVSTDTTETDGGDVEPSPSPTGAAPPVEPVEPIAQPPITPTR